MGLVFISAKSEDYPHARRVFRFLRDRGITAFFAPESLPEQAKSKFGRAIDEKLDEAAHFVLVTSSAEYVASGYVRDEWEAFREELRAGRKEGNLVTMTAGPVAMADLPGPLRHYEVMGVDDRSLVRLLSYVSVGIAADRTSDSRPVAVTAPFVASETDIDTPSTDRASDAWFHFRRQLRGCLIAVAVRGAVHMGRAASYASPSVHSYYDAYFARFVVPGAIAVAIACWLLAIRTARSVPELPNRSVVRPRTVLVWLGLWFAAVVVLYWFAERIEWRPFWHFLTVVSMSAALLVVTIVSYLLGLHHRQSPRWFPRRLAVMAAFLLGATLVHEFGPSLDVGPTVYVLVYGGAVPVLTIGSCVIAKGEMNRSEPAGAKTRFLWRGPLLLVLIAATFLVLVPSAGSGADGYRPDVVERIVIVLPRWAFVAAAGWMSYRVARSRPRLADGDAAELTSRTSTAPSS